MPKPSGFSNGFNPGFGVGRYRYVLTPYSWNPTGVGTSYCWELPKSCVGAIDLRPIPAQSARDGTPSGFAFVASLQPTNGIAVVTSLHMSEEITTSAMQDAWQSGTGYRPNGATLTDLLWDQLTAGSDPTGESGPKPLVPDTEGLLRLYIGGHSLVKQERFRWGHHPHTEKLRQLIRLGFERTWEQSQSIRSNSIRNNELRHCRKVLGSHCQKYGISDWKEFVPQRLHSHIEGPLQPETTITESFNQTDSTTVGPDLSWTEYAIDIVNYDTFRTVSNQLNGHSAAVLEQTCRANTNLSGADHYAQISVTGIGTLDNNIMCGTAVRHSASVQTCYVATVRQFDDIIRLFKIVAGTGTTLGSSPSVTTSGLPKIVKCEVSGSTLKSFWAGAETESITDTAIDGSTVGGLRCGVHGFADFTADSFEAADLGGGGDIEEDATPIVLTSSVVNPTVSLSQTFTPVATTATVVTPGQTIATSPGAIQATGSVATGSTALAAPIIPIAVTGSVVTPTTGGDLSESPNPIILTGTVVTPSHTLGTAILPVVITGSVVIPSTVLSIPITPVVITGTVVTPSDSRSVAPDPVVGTSSLVIFATSLAYTPSPITATTSVITPNTQVGNISPPGGINVIGNTYIPGVVRGWVYTAGGQSGNLL